MAIADGAVVNSMIKAIGKVHEQWFEQRGISLETAVQFGIYTGKSLKVGDRSEVVPDVGGNILVFPFFEHGSVVSEKYRGPGKRFWQREGGKRTFYNSDILDDPALADGSAALTITEGEPDMLTAIECGFPYAVSVPDGAPAVPKNEDPEQLAPIDPNKEGEGKFEFLFVNRDRLKRIKRFIIAVDDDRPGKRLAAELVRRLSASRCLFVTYPSEPVVPTDKIEEWPDGKRPCKDLNEVRTYFGPEAVAEVLNSAKPYPVSGLYRLREFPDLPPIKTYSTGWSILDRHFLPFLGGLVFILGIPGHGKSIFIANLLNNLSEQLGWRAAIFSPEEPTVPAMRDKFRKIRLRRSPYELDREEIRKVDDWINDRFLFIASDPLGNDEEELYLDWILDRATDAVMRDGIRILVIDPWNEVEQSRQRNETQTEYIGRSLRALNRFRRQHLQRHTTPTAARISTTRPTTS
jgi:twinkle protein